MFKLIGIFSAALLVTLLFGGYFAMRRQQAEKTASDSHQALAPEQAEPLKLHVFEDEAYLKRSQAIVGGTVENVSGERLTELAVTIKLQSSDGRHEELKIVPLNPSALEPGARGSYQMAVPSGKWKGAKVVSVTSTEARQEYAFKSSRGNLRPREQQSVRQARTIIVERPAPRKKGEEFLNTPDNPVIIK